MRTWHKVPELNPRLYYSSGQRGHWDYVQSFIKHPRVKHWFSVMGRSICNGSFNGNDVEPNHS